MSDEQTEFRDEIKHVVRRHDPDPDELRALAERMDALADRYEAAEEVL